MDAQRYDKQCKRAQNPCPRIDLGVKSEGLRSLRRRAMDAQRYIVSKGVPVASCVHDITETPSCDSADKISSVDCATVAGNGIAHEDDEGYIAPLTPPPTPSFFYHHDDSDLSNLMDVFDTAAMEEAKIKVGLARVGNDPKPQKGCVIETDDFERKGYTLTRTIIQPTESNTRTPIFGIFLQPSLRLLNCCSYSAAFEEEVDMISARRRKELRGEGDIHVFVTEDKCIEV